VGTTQNERCEPFFFQGDGARAKLLATLLILFFSKNTLLMLLENTSLKRQLERSENVYRMV